MEISASKEKLPLDRQTCAEDDYKFSDSPCGAHSRVIELVGKNKKVLDVGCSCGYLGEKFKENGCYVVGIESDEASARKASPLLDGLINVDVESLEKLAYPENFFDVIVLADILEHLKRPDVLLAGLKKYLNNDGYLVVSLPNIARIDIRIKLLFGNFNYDNGGIMDKTHLRFFTKKTAIALLEESGYSVIKTDSSGFFSRPVIFRPFLNMLVFQFIFLAKKRKD